MSAEYRTLESVTNERSSVFFFPNKFLVDRVVDWTDEKWEGILHPGQWDAPEIEPVKLHHLITSCYQITSSYQKHIVG
jgi:hypothetical protein